MVTMLIATLFAATPLPAQDPQIWSDHSIATGQGLVLDHMNREAAKKAHREAGLPPPDFKAARKRVSTRRPARMTASERASKCRVVRANLHRLDARQMAIYRKGCT